MLAPIGVMKEPYLALLEPGHHLRRLIPNRSTSFHSVEVSP